MKFQLYLELATRTEDEKILELLRMPRAKVLSDIQWAAKWWSHGRTRTMRSMDRERLILALSREGLNELDLSGKATAGADGMAPTVVGAWILLTLSPMNILWSPVPEEVLSNPHEERKRRNHAMHEPIRAGEFATPYPSTVEYLMDIESAEPETSDLVQVAFDFIRHASEPAMASLDLFGYACIGGDQRRAQMTHNVASRGGSIDQLGKKFDNVYQIMIGPKASCEGLAAALQTAPPQPLLPSGPSQTYIFTVPVELGVPPGPRSSDVLAPSAADPSVRKWLA